MNDKKNTESLSGIPEDKKGEDATKNRLNKKKHIIILGIVAVCVSLIVMGSFLAHYFIALGNSSEMLDNDNNNNSFFTITANSDSGETTKLSVLNSCLNSSKPRSNIFGNDSPTFNLSVTPSDYQSNEHVYKQFDISVSYGGTTVDAKDEHICIAYLFSHQGSDKISGYSIIGWFIEPTDIDVTFTDKESKEVVEKITINVKYDSNLQEYELMITKIDTEFDNQ